MASISELLGLSKKQIKETTPDEIVSNPMEAKSSNLGQLIPDLSKIDIDNDEEKNIETPQQIKKITPKKKLTKKEKYIENLEKEFQVSEIHDKIKLEEEIIDEKVELIKAKNKRRNKISTLLGLNKSQEATTQESSKEKNQELTDLYNEIAEVPVSNVINLESALDAIESNIEETTEIQLDIDDFNIREIPGKKDKSGYTKTIVSVKSELFEQITSINFKSFLSQLNVKTNNIINHRITDSRVINNTNKTQLKNSQLKLSAFTLTFKPDFRLLKVNKYKRIMISFLSDSFVIYIQDSREKRIVEINNNKFSDSSEIENFLINVIYDFYFVNYTSAYSRIDTLINGSYVEDDDFFKLSRVIVKNGDYLIKMRNATEQAPYNLISIKSKRENNQFLIVNIKINILTNKIEIYCTSTINKNWRADIELKGQATIKYLLTTINSLLEQIYSKKWNVIGDSNNQQDEKNMNIYVMQNKLTYIPLRKAFEYIFNIIENTDNPNKFEITKTLSKFDTESLLAKDNMLRESKSYAAEGIIGKTNKTNYFVLLWLAVPIISGDKRIGREYISTDEYYEKYKVAKTDRTYQERENLKTDKNRKELAHVEDKQKDDFRNYNARKFMFQLEYQLTGKSNVIIKHFTNFQDFLKIIN